MQDLRDFMSKSQYHKGFARSEIQKVHEQKMEKSQQSQQPSPYPLSSSFTRCLLTGMALAGHNDCICPS
jgi:alpha-D-ribose 1-methylphosphonate 5-triphosphate diphosphatase PhnM